MAAGCRGLFFLVPPDVGHPVERGAEPDWVPGAATEGPSVPCTQVASMGADMLRPGCWSLSSSETCLCCYLRMGRVPLIQMSGTCLRKPLFRHKHRAGVRASLPSVPWKRGSASVQVNPSLAPWSPWHRAVSAGTPLSSQWPSRTQLRPPSPAPGPALEHPPSKRLEVNQLHVSKQRALPVFSLLLSPSPVEMESRAASLVANVVNPVAQRMPILFICFFF